MLFVSSVCVSLVAVEVAARFLLYEQTNLEGMFTGDPVVGYTLAPRFRGSHRTAEFRYDVAINELGMRDDLPPARSPGGVRILVIGDSFVFGQGVQLSQTSPKVLQQRLRLSNRSRRVEVFNGGVPGYSPFQELHVLRRVARWIQPDIVVQVVFMGDDWYGNGPRQKPEEVRRHPIEQLRRKSSAFRFLERVALSRFKGHEYYEPHRTSPRPDFLARMEHVLRLLEETRSVSSQHGAQYVAALCPRYAQVYDDAWAQARVVYSLAHRDYTPFEPNRRFARHLDVRGIPHIDLLDSFRREGQRRRLHFEIDGHWNPDGHELVADVLAARMETLLNGPAGVSPPASVRPD